MELTSAITNDESTWKSFPVALAITIGYLFMVARGPQLMKDRSPLSLKGTMMVYNLLQVFMNAHILYLVVDLMGFRIFDLWTNACRPISSANSDQAAIDKAAFIMVYYYLNKVSDLLDTVFHVLRKKDSQLSTLHVFHHSSVVLASWVSAFVMKVELQTHMVSLNASVHLVMYTYYLFAGMGPAVQKFLWWKRYVTEMQITQFLLVLSMLVKSQWDSCDHHPWFATMWELEVTVLLMLFLDFYKRSYAKPSKDCIIKNK